MGNILNLPILHWGVGERIKLKNFDCVEIVVNSAFLKQNVFNLFENTLPLLFEMHFILCRKVIEVVLEVKLEENILLDSLSRI